MRYLRAFVLIIIISLSAATSNHSRVKAVSTGSTYYVAPSGNDTNPGSISQPWRTIHKAAGKVQPGDVVYIRAGTYQESNSFYTDGTQPAPITLTGYPGEVATISGNVYQIPGKGSGGALIQVYGDWYIIRDLTVTGSGDQGVTLHGAYDMIDNIYSHHNWGWGILMTGNHEITQNSRVWSNSMMNENNAMSIGWSGGVTCARYPDYCTIRRTSSWENWGEGISTFESLHTTIEANTAYDNDNNIYISDTKYALVQGNLSYCTPGNRLRETSSQNGMLIYDELGVPIPLGSGGVRYPSSDNRLLNNIFRGCDNNLFATQEQSANNVYAYNTFVNSVGTTPGYTANVQFISGTAANQRFVNNLVYQSDNKPILQIDQPGVIAFSNNLWSKAPPSSFKASGAGDVIGDPKLTMTGTPFSPFWYTLTGTSPAINAGKVIPEINADFYGAARGILPDIGALEFGIKLPYSIFIPCIYYCFFDSGYLIK
jgi:hypothetical protein